MYHTAIKMIELELCTNKDVTIKTMLRKKMIYDLFITMPI